MGRQDVLNVLYVLITEQGTGWQARATPTRHTTAITERAIKKLKLKHDMNRENKYEE